MTNKPVSTTNPIKNLFNKTTKPNIILIVTDQQRSHLCWPKSFQQTLLDAQPALMQLMKKGVSFNKTFTGAAMCTPSRGAFLTSKFPPETGTTTTGASLLPLPPPASNGVANISSILSSAGYDMKEIQWRGKWHLLGNLEFKASESPEQVSVVKQGGFAEWQSPDAGITTGTSYMGGGSGSTNNNDANYLSQALSYLKNKSAKPFCLVVSFVNPHDICTGNSIVQGETSYINKSGSSVSIPGSSTSGYENFEITYNGKQYPLLGGIPGYPAPIPTNVAQLPTDAPRAVESSPFRWPSYLPTPTDAMDPANVTTDQQQNYLNFYAGLHVYVDNQIQNILDVVTGAGGGTAIDDTLIVRFSDHGEMGLNHSLVEKFYVAYDEAMHVPLVFSNLGATSTNDVPNNLQTDNLASSVDILPTLAALLNVDTSKMGLRGVSLEDILTADDPSTVGPVQDYVHFAYDDIQNNNAPSHIRTIRTQDWKYSVFFTSNGTDSDYELFDLVNDPDENTNLAGQSAHQQQEHTLDMVLKNAMTEKKTLPSQSPPSLSYPKNMSNSSNSPFFTFWPPLTTKGSHGFATTANKVDDKLPQGSTDAIGMLSGDTATVFIDALVTAVNNNDTTALGKLLQGKSDETAVAAAHELAKIGTDEARIALNPGLYQPMRSPQIMAKIHGAWAHHNPL